MQQKGVFIIFLLILLGAFGFVMFSPNAKKDEAENTTQNTQETLEVNTEVNKEENNMENTDQDPIVIEILKEGAGNPAVSGDTVVVSYIGTLTNGTEFDKSANHGDGKFSFKLGAGMVIRGWDEGIAGMKVGEVRKLTISPEYAYGDRAIGSIPANSTLVFEVEMFEIKK